MSHLVTSDTAETTVQRGATVEARTTTDTAAQRGTIVVDARTTAEWRAWLAANGGVEQEVWLVIHHQRSGVPTVRYHEAIEHSLCYGWIDSLARRRDADSFQLRFTPRNPRSTWSRVNRERAGRMIELGLMTPAGSALIELAKATGTWQVRPDGDPSALPDDLRALLDASPTAGANFAKFPPSSKRLILDWIAGAKKPETRQRRIDRTVALAAENIRANHPGAARALPA